MAVGFPAKTTYANGDVFSASDINDTNGTLNLAAGAPWAAGKNKIINGDFGVWQRGTSFTAAGGFYCADRFTYISSTTPTVSQQSFTPGDISGYNPQYFLRFVKGNTTADALSITQKIENVRTFAGQTVTLSFWAKGSVAFTNEPLTRQVFGTGGSGDVYSTYTTQSVTTSWARYSMTFTMPSVTGKTIGADSFTQLYFIRYTGTPNITVDVWGVQLELGSTATAFQTATGTIQGELAACQRYLPAFNYGSATGYGGNVFFYSSTGAVAFIPFQVTPRTQPTGATLSAGSTFQIDGVSNYTVSAIAYSTSYYSGASVNLTTSGGTAGQAGALFFKANSSILFTGCEL